MLSHISPGLYTYSFCLGFCLCLFWMSPNRSHKFSCIGEIATRKKTYCKRNISRTVTCATKQTHYIRLRPC